MAMQTVTSRLERTARPPGRAASPRRAASPGRVTRRPRVGRLSPGWRRGVLRVLDGSIANLVVLVVLTVLSVYKPWGRTRRGKAFLNGAGS